MPTQVFPRKSGSRSTTPSNPETKMNQNGSCGHCKIHQNSRFSACRCAQSSASTFLRPASTWHCLSRLNHQPFHVYLLSWDISIHTHTIHGQRCPTWCHLVFAVFHNCFSLWDPPISQESVASSSSCKQSRQFPGSSVINQRLVLPQPSLWGPSWYFLMFNGTQVVTLAQRLQRRPWDHHVWNQKTMI